jgi:cell division septation protein DedD
MRANDEREGCMRVARVMMLLLAACLPVQAIAQHEVDSTLARIERLIMSGERAMARGVTDSLVATLPSESARYPDALYWRAASASNAADAERDYLRIVIEHPLAARAPDALMALAQLEFARADRAAARRRFDQLLRDYPSGRHVPRASLWSGRLAIEDRDTAAGCATLKAARPQVPATDVELANQFDYFLAQCARATPADTTTNAPAQNDTAAAEPSGRAWSIQVAAFRTRTDATALASRLRARGFNVRVVGDQPLYRVRIGRYPTHAEATAALRRSRISGIIVEAEPR